MSKRLVFVLACVVIWPSVQAAEIYQWTDDAGRTHASDRPPVKNRQVKKIDSHDYELTEVQQRDAAAKVLADKDKLQQQSKRAATELPASSEALPPYSLSGVPPKESDCERMTRLYRESEACFGPYKQVNGTTKAEAFERCEERPDTSNKCGDVR